MSLWSDNEFLRGAAFIGYPELNGPVIEGCCPFCKSALVRGEWIGVCPDCGRGWNAKMTRLGGIEVCGYTAVEGHRLTGVEHPPTTPLYKGSVPVDPQDTGDAP